MDMEQWTGSELGMEYIKVVYCHPAYVTYMQNTSWEMLDWKKHKKVECLQNWRDGLDDWSLTFQALELKWKGSFPVKMYLHLWEKKDVERSWGVQKCWNMAIFDVSIH